VSNGFFSKAALEALDYVAAMNIDLKGYSEDFYGKVACARLEPVKENIKRVWEKGIWLEVTTLIIPTVNDGAEELSALAAFIAEVSPDIPWHLSRFHPLRNQRHLSMTPESTLEKAREIGKSAGLKYVYLGNVRGADYADTFCPGCGAKLLQRDGFSVSTNLIGGSGVCPQCGEKIAGIW
jgi:pyruvate formate lyase activating enzyme